MPWIKDQLRNHVKAAALLEEIKNQSFNYLSKSPQITEYQLQQFILTTPLQQELIKI